MKRDVFDLEIERNKRIVQFDDYQTFHLFCFATWSESFQERFFFYKMRPVNESSLRILRDFDIGLVY